jgi:hypothetical protein
MTEPIAWRATDRGKTLLTDDTEFILKMWKHNGFKIEPLYLLRELTDEEIEHIAQQHLTVHVQFIGAGDCTIEGEIEFARAILKKASEK